MGNRTRSTVRQLVRAQLPEGPNPCERQAATSRNAAPPRPRNALVSSVEVAQFIEVAVPINLQRSFHTFSACSFRRLLAAERAAPLPKGSSLDHDYFLARGNGRAGTASSPPTETPQRWVKLVPAFVVAFVPGTTRPRERACHCLAARSPDSRRLLLAGHSQTAAFQAPG